MKALKITVLCLVLIYTIPAFFMSAFSSEGSKGLGNIAEPLIIISPHLLWFMSLIVCHVYPKLNNSVLLIISPLVIPIVFFIIFLVYVSIENKNYEKEKMSKHLAALREPVNLLPDSIPKKDIKYYSVRIIKEKPQTILLALQEPYEYLLDVWGNRGKTYSTRTGVTFWLITRNKNGVKVTGSGFIKNRFISDSYYSNVGYYKQAFFGYNADSTKITFSGEKEVIFYVRANFQNDSAVLQFEKMNEKKILFNELANELNK